MAFRNPVTLVRWLLTQSCPVCGVPFTHSVDLVPANVEGTIYRHLSCGENITGQTVIVRIVDPSTLDQCFGFDEVAISFL